jgi:hypothetical protein
MEFKEQSVPTGILLKIRKLQALAERGVGGEATNAKILLSALCEKYGIDESKLDEEEKQWYEFEMRTSVQKLFLQLYVSIYGTTERYLQEVELWKRGRKKIVKCKFTRAEYIEFSQLWEWHRKNYLAERKRMRELFKIAYFDKFKMYASETCDEYEAQRSKKKDDDFTFEDLMAINMMAAACKNKSFYKQIGEANDDEDDD